MNRIRELDALRGLAALAITIYHLRPSAVPLGWAPVDLFMVLSGYLITTIILKNQEAKGFLVRFYARRSLRIWPLYFLTLGFLVVINGFLPKPFPMDGLRNYATFTPNVQRYWSGEVPPFNWYFLHTWSIALEEQFYLIWPALICLIGRRRLGWAALAIVGGSVIARACGMHWWLLAARCDGFALGGLLALLFDALGRGTLDRRRLQTVFALSAAGGGVLLALSLGKSWGHDFDGEMSTWPSLVLLALVVLDFALIGLVVMHAGSPLLGPLQWSWLTGLGQVSFGLYLLHPLVLIAMSMAGRRLGIPETWWYGGLQVGASVAVATASWHILERPILRLKDRFAYKGTGRVAPAVGTESSVAASSGLVPG